MRQRQISVTLKRRTLANGRPPYSYIALICMAISSNDNKRANLRQMIHYIEKNFAYYRSDQRWHGTLRHHLSFNDCFIKCRRRSGERLCQWTVNPDYCDMFDNGSFLRRRYRTKKGGNNDRRQRANNIKETQQDGGATNKSSSSLPSVVNSNSQQCDCR
ncbi:hypothetical protein LSH36_859g02068 [Paralvinella palmiformis]|uniref:Fork-head domain-containing protein n=1 Tax=Paralvinella palmiformis TaxID=53620 RepID=A0AAD9MRZ7_9ANNE|nr:hypothetical protein LSH36_859g02068 [Paralvinella palmiformis]